MGFGKGKCSAYINLTFDAEISHSRLLELGTSVHISSGCMESSRACWTGEGEIEFYLLLDRSSHQVQRHIQTLPAGKQKLSCAFCMHMAAKPLF
jgi:hypothetical protein